MAPVSRRSFLQSAAALGIAVPNLRALNALAVTPDRPVTTALMTALQRPLPDIQFAINDYIAPPTISTASLCGSRPSTPATNQGEQRPVDQRPAARA